MYIIIKIFFIRYGEKNMLARLFFTLLLPISYAMADEAYADQAYEKSYEASSILQIAFQQPDSIECLEGEKLYLKIENIYPIRNGYVLCNGHHAIVLPSLSSDQNGYYLPCRSYDSYDLTCSNPRCGYKWSYLKTTSIYCPKCGSIGNSS